jgi:hypothetical protein
MSFSKPEVILLQFADNATYDHSISLIARSDVTTVSHLVSHFDLNKILIPDSGLEIHNLSLTVTQQAKVWKLF